MVKLSQKRVKTGKKNAFNRINLFWLNFLVILPTFTSFNDIFESLIIPIFTSLYVILLDYHSTVCIFKLDYFTKNDT